MSQITRGQLKSIVKECLVEILSESLLKESTNSSPVSLKNEVLTNQIKNKIPPRSESPALKSVLYGQNSSSKSPAASLKNSNRSAIKNHVGSITSDPIMSQIFEDTASTTLQEQIYAERSPGRSTLSDIVEESSQEFSSEFLTESAKNWSTLAFSETPKNR